MLLRTPFYDFHLAAGAKMVPFAGWEMPLLYRGIVEEHNHTRAAGSMFDVSHMGRLHITGKDAIALLNLVLTRNVEQQRVGQSRYSLICNPAGGVIDDVIVSKDVKNWLVVCNASNRDAVVKQFTQVRDERGINAQIADQTQSTAMVALQGPKIIDEIADMLPVEVRDLKRYGFETGIYMMSRISVFRSGYTGEDGAELIFSAGLVNGMFKRLAERMLDSDSIIKPAGLGARDTLRLEASMPLYGHELNDNTDPLSAGLQWAVDLNKDFIGCQPLRGIAQHGPSRKLVGLELAERRIARQATPVLAGQTVIGQVCSGTFAPTLHKSIAMAYVDAKYSPVGTELSIDFKGSVIPAKVVTMPFYRRSNPG